MPDRIGQGGQRRGADRADARFYVCRRPAYCCEPVEGGRSGHERADETVLSRTAGARANEPGRGFTSSSVVDLERETVESALLLGGLRPAGRVEVIWPISPCDWNRPHWACAPSRFLVQYEYDQFELTGEISWLTPEYLAT